MVSFYFEGCECYHLKSNVYGTFTKLVSTLQKNEAKAVFKCMGVLGKLARPAPGESERSEGSRAVFF